MNAHRRLSSVELLTEASQWHLLSRLLSRPVPERKREARELAAEIGDQRLRATALEWCENADEGNYLHLLGPGGQVPARAVAYRPFADPGWMLADIGRYHRAFGFDPLTEEPADHIALLAAFVSYLLLKEAYALENADAESADIALNARERFIDEYLVPVAPRMAERLDACGATNWSALARLIAEKLPEPQPAAVGPTLEPEVMQCDGCKAS
jgi:nitrate reductase assembly molybdenum cofactor insertion protein NarJ